MAILSTNTVGTLMVFVTSAEDFTPIADATVTLSFTGDPDSLLSTLTTDSSGQTPAVSLPAPPPDYSLSPDAAEQPYSEITVTVQADGYETEIISGSELLPDSLSVQPVRLHRLQDEESETIVIPPHTLFGDYPPKIPEEEIKPVEESGEIVLSRVVIPEYIIVHDGPPGDSGAKDYWVRYKDYIKNVACCEIYSTWPESTIYANILAIQSFTLNRVYTEWYRNKGYPFTITSSTAYDHKWIYGRNIYENISRLVDNVFANYLSRPGVRQPIFTAYCDGDRVNCKGLSQWGSMYLGNEGYSAIEILRYYYGNDLFINSADFISGVPSSYPGYELTVGTSGEKIRQLQTQLARISKNFPAIPAPAADGIYGPNTEKSVKTFQQVFGLPATGITDYATWYKISEVYVGVTRVSEP